MEKRRILLLLTLPLLVGCGNTNSPYLTPSESESQCTCGSTPSESESTLESESEVVESGEVIITEFNCPQGSGNSYPAPGEYSIDDYNFIFNDVMNGGGKLTTVSTYIQMKKQSGYIQNVTSFNNATIDIKILVNEAEYVGDMTHELTVSAGDEFGIYDTILEASSTRDETYLYCHYETSKDYSYFNLENISSYAAYIKEIKFIW